MQSKWTLMAAVGAIALAGYSCGGAQDGGAALKNPAGDTAATPGESATGSNAGDTTSSTDGDMTSSDPSGTNTSGGTNDSPGNTGGGTDSGTDTPSGDSGTTISDSSGGICEPTPFSSTQSVAAYATQYEVLLYQATSTERGTNDVLSLEIYQNSQFGGPNASGSYQFDGSNYSNCGLCMLVYADCSDPTNMGSCEKTYFAESGTVHFTAMGQIGDQLTASLEDVVLTQVTVNTETWESTPVEGGDEWCAHGYELTAPIQDYDNPTDTGSGTGDTPGDTTGSTGGSSAAECGPGSGTGVGDTIADFQLQNCLGETVSLHGKCGDAKAIWMAQVAGWCGACTTWVPEMSNAYQQYSSIGLQIYVVLGQNNNGDAPSQAECQQYASSHSVDPALLLIDPNWQTMNSNINSYGASGIPWNVVLNGANMEYVYSDTATNGMDLNGALNQLLQ